VALVQTLIQFQGVHVHYRDILKEDFLLRVKKNSQYSIRAFSRDIGISASFLSQILNQQRRLSEISGRTISQRLNWPEKKQWLFLKLIQLEKSECSQLREEILDQINKFTQPVIKFKNLELEKFKYISEWYHLALIELMEIKGFISDPKWIAKKLDIKHDQVIMAIKRLHYLGLIDIKNKKYIKKFDNQIQDVSSSALKTFHQTMINKALKAITEQAYNRRHISAITFAINENKLDEAKMKITQFRKEMNELLVTGEKTSVYQLNIQLFEITKTISNESEKS